MFEPSVMSKVRLGLFKRLFNVMSNNAIETIDSVVDIGFTDILEFGEDELVDAVKFLHRFFDINDEPEYENVIKYYDNTRKTLSSAYLWSLKGCSYTAFDIGPAKGAIRFDLNYSLQDSYNFSEVFDAVVSLNGTLEHIFDQNACFSSIHSLCKEGGGIIALQVTADGDLDHGLYSYQPNFFTALSKANNYHILDLNFNVADKKSGEIYFYDYINDGNKRNINLEDLLGKDKVLHIYFIARKLIPSSFIKPLQEDYLKYIEDNEILSKYFLLYNNLIYGDRVCVFGTKQAATIAYSLAQRVGLKIEYFVDDFATGNLFGINIINWECFLKLEIPILIGPDQVGITKERETECRIIKI